MKFLRRPGNEGSKIVWISWDKMQTKRYRWFRRQIYQILLMKKWKWKLAA